MDNKLIYWMPLIGVIVSLANAEKENGMGIGWAYYQAFMFVAFIMLMVSISI